jgi:hypothetical protein
MLLLSVACNSEIPIPQIASGNQYPNDSEHGGGQFLAESKGPLEITPVPENDKEIPNLPGDQGGGNISSDSGQGQIEEFSGEPGQIDSFAPAELQGEEEPETINWLTYLDEQFNFSIAYPESYTILPEIGQLQEVKSGLIQQVRFQDVKLTASKDVSLDLPQFTIELYALGNLTLEEFIKSTINGVKFDQFNLGGLPGFRIKLNTLIAPNEFYFFTDDVYVFKLIPLGQYSQKMLASFQLHP